MNFTRKTYFIGIIAIIAVAALWKLGFLFFDKFPFNSDEAIVGLMARHIVEGDRPVFFYGQSYMGSLDGILVAFGFIIAGIRVESIRYVQIVLFSLVILTSMIISNKVHGSKTASIISGILLAVPTVNLTLYTTVSLGGYNEALLIGNIIILIAIKIKQILGSKGFDLKLSGGLFLLLGCMAGLGIWANGLTLVYIFGSGLFLIWSIFSSSQNKISLIISAFLFSATGVLIGAFPYIAYGFSNGWANLFGELFGSAVSVETGSLFTIWLDHIRNFFLLGIPVIFGLRPPWGVNWLALPLIPVILIVWANILWFYAKKSSQTENPKGYSIIFLGTILILIASFVITSFGIDPSGRYFLPISVILSIIAGFTISKQARKWQFVIVGSLILFNVFGTIQSAMVDPPALTTQFDATTIIDHSYDDELIQFLIDKGEYFGYTNYWVAYPLAFKSGEEVIFIPNLAYHLDMRYTERDNRYQPYQDRVESADRVAYITTNHPLLEDYLRKHFIDNSVSWKEKALGDYLIFYELSTVIRPEDIGLGVTK